MFCPLDHFVLSLGQLFSQESYIPAKVKNIMLFSSFIVVVLPVNKKNALGKKNPPTSAFFLLRLQREYPQRGSWNVQGGRGPEKYARPDSAKNAR